MSIFESTITKLLSERHWTFPATPATGKAFVRLWTPIDSIHGVDQEFVGKLARVIEGPKSKKPPGECLAIRHARKPRCRDLSALNLRKSLESIECAVRVRAKGSGLKKHRWQVQFTALTLGVMSHYIAHITRSISAGICRPLHSNRN